MRTKKSNAVQIVESIIKKVLNEARSYPLKYISERDYDKYKLGDFPNFSATGNITGMKKQYYGQDAKLVKCGKYIFNVSSEPDIYEYASNFPVK